MSGDLRELYQEVILDHGKHPRNRRELQGANCTSHGRNPLCGDDFEIFLIVDDSDRVADVSFKGNGCAISVASASIMTELLKGKTRRQAEVLFNAFHLRCTGVEGDLDESLAEDDIAYLDVLAGVRQFPVRVKCATLAWHTMKAALDGRDTASSDLVDEGEAV